MSIDTLTGRFAALTLLFVALAEIFVLIPSVSNFRLDYLQTRLEKAQIASLTLLATDENENIAAELESELLANAGVYNVVLRRDDVRAVLSGFIRRSAGLLEAIIRDGIASGEFAPTDARAAALALDALISGTTLPLSLIHI